MPTYDYKCSACSHAFEQFQSMKDKPLRKCPKCGKSALERLIGTGGAIIFKGGGFYQTDYRSDSYKKAAEAESKPAEAKPSETASKPDGKAGDAAPAKPESAPAKSAADSSSKAAKPDKPAPEKSKAGKTKSK